jgi:hypothetical protein
VDDPSTFVGNTFVSVAEEVNPDGCADNIDFVDAFDVIA